VGRAIFFGLVFTVAGAAMGLHLQRKYLENAKTERMQWIKEAVEVVEQEQARERQEKISARDT